MEIRNQKILKIGNGYYIGVPTRYVKDGHIDPDGLYDFDLRKANEERNETDNS